ncbi:MAG: hypothetical protein OEY14_13140, partial [Myxococcales bacterium]|nr:hypothetical protein [Myxococcales bacterium]
MISPRAVARLYALLALPLAFGPGCSGGDAPTSGDGGAIDASTLPPLPSLDHCATRPSQPTARAGQTVGVGTLEAGVAEAFLDAPLGTSLGAYTSRAEAVGGDGLLPSPDGR